MGPLTLFRKVPVFLQSMPTFSSAFTLIFTTRESVNNVTQDCNQSWPRFINHWDLAFLELPDLLSTMEISWHQPKHIPERSHFLESDCGNTVTLEDVHVKCTEQFNMKMYLIYHCISPQPKKVKVPGFRRLAQKCLSLHLSYCFVNETKSLLFLLSCRTRPYICDERPVVYWRYLAPVRGRGEWPHRAGAPEPFPGATDAGHVRDGFGGQDRR